MAARFAACSSAATVPVRPVPEWQWKITPSGASTISRTIGATWPSAASSARS
jgi:hypothetical protein